MGIVCQCKTICYNPRHKLGSVIKRERECFLSTLIVIKLTRTAKTWVFVANIKRFRKKYFVFLLTNGERRKESYFPGNDKLFPHSSSTLYVTFPFEKKHRFNLVDVYPVYTGFFKADLDYISVERILITLLVWHFNLKLDMF